MINQFNCLYNQFKMNGWEQRLKYQKTEAEHLIADEIGNTETTTSPWVDFVGILMQISNNRNSSNIENTDGRPAYMLYTKTKLDKNWLVKNNECEMIITEDNTSATNINFNCYKLSLKK